MTNIVPGEPNIFKKICSGTIPYGKLVNWAKTYRFHFNPNFKKSNVQIKKIETKLCLGQS